MFGDGFRLGGGGTGSECLTEDLNLLVGEGELVERPRQLRGQLLHGALLVLAHDPRGFGYPDVEARFGPSAGDFEAEGFADELLEVGVVDQADPVGEEFAHEHAMLVGASEPSADEDPLLEGLVVEVPE